MPRGSPIAFRRASAFLGRRKTPSAQEAEASSGRRGHGQAVQQGPVVTKVPVAQAHQLGAPAPVHRMRGVLDTDANPVDQTCTCATLVEQSNMQLRAFCKSKIHRATVTGAELEYIGSVAIDADLLEKTDIRPGEKVCVWNLNNGERIETYAIYAPPHSGAIVLNGAAARKFQTGDKVIIATFVLTDEPVETRMALVDDANRFVQFLDDNQTHASIEHFLKPADEVSADEVRVRKG